VTGIEFPATGQAAPGFLQDNFEGWRSGLAAQSAMDLESALGHDRGMYAGSTRTDLALHILDELIHHAAEISLLPDLYRQRAGLGHSGSR
jgi:hypothetical protein